MSLCLLDVDGVRTRTSKCGWLQTRSARATLLSLTLPWAGKALPKNPMTGIFIPGGPYVPQQQVTLILHLHGRAKEFFVYVAPTNRFFHDGYSEFPGARAPLREETEAAAGKTPLFVAQERFKPRMRVGTDVDGNYREISEAYALDVLAALRRMRALSKTAQLDPGMRSYHSHLCHSEQGGPMRELVVGRPSLCRSDSASAGASTVSAARVTRSSRANGAEVAGRRQAFCSFPPKRVTSLGGAYGGGGARTYVLQDGLHKVDCVLPKEHWLPRRGASADPSGKVEDLT